MVKIQNHPSPTMRKISWSHGDNELGPCVRSSNQLVDKKNISPPPTPRKILWSHGESLKLSIPPPPPPQEKSHGLVVKNED